MIKRGWSVAELAKRAGVNVKVLYNFRSGKPIGMKTIYAVAKAFDLSVEALQGVEEPAKQMPSGAHLSTEEQDVLSYLRRLSPSNRRRAARLLREIVDELEEAERTPSESTSSSTKSAGKPTPGAT